MVQRLIVIFKLKYRIFSGVASFFRKLKFSLSKFIGWLSLAGKFKQKRVFSYN